MTITSEFLRLCALLSRLRSAVPSISRRKRSSCAREKMDHVMFPLKLVTLVILPAIVAACLPALAESSNPEADAQAGAVLFRDKGCAHCHGDGGVGTAKAPSLVDIRKDKAWPPDKMTDHILNGGQKMPPFRESLNDDEIGQIIAYLRAKNRPAPPTPLANGSGTPTAPAPRR